MPALLQILFHQGQVIVFVWHDAKRKIIFDAEDADCSCGLMRVDLRSLKPLELSSKIPIRRKRLAPKSIEGHPIKAGQRIDRIINAKAYLSQRDRNQYNDQNVSTDSPETFACRHITGLNTDNRSRLLTGGYRPKPGLCLRCLGVTHNAANSCSARITELHIVVVLVPMIGTTFAYRYKNKLCVMDLRR